MNREVHVRICESLAGWFRRATRPLSQLASRFNINANLIVKWKKLLLDNSAEVFASGKGLAPDRESEIKDLQAKIGEITMEVDFLSKALGR
ncbi:MAG: hypothetical protein GY696_07465 [Gammaproteobacteria bacterium]|nr:hypothetical protein [Gammaproteobacteria bacterium]